MKAFDIGNKVKIIECNSNPKYIGEMGIVIDIRKNCIWVQTSKFGSLCFYDYEIERR